MAETHTTFMLSIGLNCPFANREQGVDGAETQQCSVGGPELQLV